MWTQKYIAGVDIYYHAWILCNDLNGTLQEQIFTDYCWIAVIGLLMRVWKFTLQEEKFHWNLNFAISLMANSLNFNSAYYTSFRNLSIIAYIIEIQKSKFANI